MIIEFCGIDKDLASNLASIVSDSFADQFIGVELLDFAQGYDINDEDHQKDLIEYSREFIATAVAPTLMRTNYSVIVVNYVTQLMSEAVNINALNVTRTLFHPVFNPDLMIIVDSDPSVVYGNMCDACRAETGLDQLNEQRRKLLKLATGAQHVMVISAVDELYEMADEIEAWILENAPKVA